MRRGFALFLLLAVPAALRADPVMAPQPLAYTQLPDARQEAKAEALMRTIRCVVCQGQSIADSDADLAGDMRAMVREKIARGQSPEEIRGWLISRYGRWVSYRPPVEPITWPLWAAPLALLASGAIIARRSFRRRRRG